MKIKLQTLVESREALKALFNESVPIQTSLKLIRVMDAVDKEYASYEKARNEIVKKLGKEKTVGAGDFYIAPEDIVTINAYIEQDLDLQQVEIEVEIEKISLRELGDIKLSAVHLRLLKTFFIE